MNKKPRRKSSTKPLLIMCTMSAAGAISITAPSSSIAQANPAQATPGQATPAQASPSSVPTAPPVPATSAKISKIIVRGNKLLSDSAIIIASGHAVGDACNEQTLDEMKLNLTAT